MIRQFTFFGSNERGHTRISYNSSGTWIVNQREKFSSKIERSSTRANATTINPRGRMDPVIGRKEEIVRRMPLIATPSAFERPRSRRRACEWQKSLQRGSSGSHKVTTKKTCVLAFLGNAERSLCRQRQVVEQVSRWFFQRGRRAMQERSPLAAMETKLARVFPRAAKASTMPDGANSVSRISRKGKRDAAREQRCSP